MSVLLPIRDYILNECNDLEQGRAKVLEALNAVPKPDIDIRRMKVDVQHRIYSLSTLKFFVSNQILASQGLKLWDKACQPQQLLPYLSYE